MLGFDAVGYRALGQVPDTLVYYLVADPGAFTLTGQDANINVSFTLTPTTFALTGVAAATAVYLSADAGSFILNGVQVNFVTSVRRPLYTSGHYWKGVH